MRKGQSATEYLVTYGWAILAIAIVGVLLYTQGFSREDRSEERMDIGAINQCMMDCKLAYSDIDQHNYLIPYTETEKCAVGIDMIVNAGVPQDRIDEYNRTCYETLVEETDPEQSQYNYCILACFE